MTVEQIIELLLRPEIRDRVIAGLIVAFIVAIVTWLLKKRRRPPESPPPISGPSQVISGPTGTTQIFMGPGSTLILPPYDYQDGIPTSPTVEVRKPFEKGREDLHKGKFHEAIKSFTEALNSAEESKNRCALFIQIGNAFYFLRQYEKAHEFYANALREAKRAHDAEGQGSALVGIAGTYVMRPAADAARRGDNVKEAVKLYSRALEIFHKNEYPVQYAMTQNNLGNLYMYLPWVTPEERAVDVRKAIDCYRATLDIHTPNEYPFEYAMTQNNLGNVYIELSLVTPEERAANILEGIKCYQAALKVHKKEKYPFHYAMIQNNLGTAYIELPWVTPEERAKNLRKAFQYFVEAYNIYEHKKDEYPVDYAMTQHNLGIAYTHLPSATPEERASNVRKAIACYQAALEIRRKDEYPQDYCQTAANLGTLLAQLRYADACYWLKEAYGLRQFLPDQGKGVGGLIEEFCKEKSDE